MNEWKIINSVCIYKRADTIHHEKKKNLEIFFPSVHLYLNFTITLRFIHFILVLPFHSRYDNLNLKKFYNF